MVQTKTPKTKVNLPTFTCNRCGHTWHPRKAERPVRCARCTSPYWDRPETVQKVQEQAPA